MQKPWHRIALATALVAALGTAPAFAGGPTKASDTKANDTKASSPSASPSMSAGELFHRQVMATFEEDALAAEAVPVLGADSCMWASDYPHTDSTFPHSRQAVDDTLGMLPEEDRRKITATNCARLYGFGS